MIDGDKKHLIDASVMFLEADFVKREISLCTASLVIELFGLAAQQAIARRAARLIELAFVAVTILTALVRDPQPR